MRVVEYRVLAAAGSPVGGLTPMDGFAALDRPLSADAAIGGFRIIRPRPVEVAAATVGDTRRSTSARLHASGTLSVLFIGGLALAVLAGPASCPCNSARTDAASVAVASHARGLSRFAYTRAAAIDIASDAPAPVELWDAPVGTAGAADGENRTLPQLAAVIEPDAGTSPISTSALPRAEDDPIDKLLAAPAHLGALPTGIETLADAAPKPIRLAAAAVDEVVPMLPLVEITTPDAPEVIPIESAPKAATETDVQPERAKPEPHARRSLRGRRARAHAARSAYAKLVREPRWAQQMFETPWQNSAFSYVR